MTEHSSYVYKCTSIRCQKLTFLGMKVLWDEADKTRQKEDLYNIVKSASFDGEVSMPMKFSRGARSIFGEAQLHSQ